MRWENVGGEDVNASLVRSEVSEVSRVGWGGESGS